MPSVHRVRTPTLPRSAAPPLYSPPSPIYHPDPTPSPASTNIVNSPAHCSDGSVIINPDCPRPVTPVFKSQSVLTFPKLPKVCQNDRNKQKLWQKIQSELSKELFKFCKEVTENISTYNQLSGLCCKM